MSVIREGIQATSFVMNDQDGKQLFSISQNGDLFIAGDIKVANKEEMNRKIQGFRALFYQSLIPGVLIGVSAEQRRHGKTTLLIEETNRTGATIIVGLKEQVGMIAPLLTNGSVEYVGSLMGLAKDNYPNGVLIEDNVSIDVIRGFIKKGVKVLGGFISMTT